MKLNYKGRGGGKLIANLYTNAGYHGFDANPVSLRLQMMVRGWVLRPSKKDVDLET